MKPGLCLSAGPTSKAVKLYFRLQSCTALKMYFRLLSPLQSQFSLQKISHGTCRTKIFSAKSPPMSRFPNVSRKFTPLFGREHPSLDGPASAHRGPCAHRALHPWGIYTQMKFWVFGYDPGITSAKVDGFSPDLLQYNELRIWRPLCHIVWNFINFK